MRVDIDAAGVITVAGFVDEVGFLPFVAVFD